MDKKSGGLLTLFTIVIGITSLVVIEFGVQLMALIPRDSYYTVGVLWIAIFGAIGTGITVACNYYDKITAEINEHREEHRDVRED